MGSALRFWYLRSWTRWNEIGYCRSKGTRSSNSNPIAKHCDFVSAEKILSQQSILWHHSSSFSDKFIGKYLFFILIKGAAQF